MEQLKNGVILFLVVAIIVLIFTGGTKQDCPEQNNPNIPGEIKPFMFYDISTGKIYAQGYDHFTYGLDSSLHVVDVRNGENSYYFVLFDMSIEFEIIKYDN